MRELGQDYKTDLRWKPEAVFTLQLAVEAFLTGYFSDVNIAAIHRKKVTIGIKDMKLIKKIRQHLPIYGTKDTEYDEMHVLRTFCCKLYCNLFLCSRSNGRVLPRFMDTSFSIKYFSTYFTVVAS